MPYPDRPYTILIDNLGFINRGDQMMIQSTIDQIRRERPEALIVVRPTIYWQNPSYWISNDIGLPEIANNYLPFFKSIVEHLTEQGEKVILLNHEGVEDEVLLHRLNEMLTVKLPVITRLSGVETKRVIASAKLLITSRFHGAVSGFMQGIPTLCTSWSHKYLELLKEMKSENNQLDVLDISSAISIIDMALSHPDLFSASAQSRDIYCTCTQDMWSKVFSYLPE